MAKGASAKKPRITDRKAWKMGHMEKLKALLNQYPKCFIVNVNNVGSKQMQQIRVAMRGHAELLLGKNTIFKNVMKVLIGNNTAPDLEKMMAHVKGNVGLVFTREELSEIREKITANRVAAPAKAGAIAPNDVDIPAQNTGLPPEKTSFFQALQIPTKINRGTIEILNDVHLIKTGQRVGASEAALLTMLKIMPFSYGLVIEKVYDSGALYDTNVLDITPESLMNRIHEGIGNIASVALALGYPTLASVKHSLLDGFKNLLAVAVESPYSFKQADKLKEVMSDPAKLAALQAASASASAAPAADKKADKAPEKKKEEPKKEAPKKKEEPPPEEEGGDMGMGLFD